MSTPKDIDLKFQKHPITGDIVIRKGNSALLQSVRNIVMTSHHEWKTAQGLGAGAYNSLGVNDIDITGTLSLKTRIAQQLTEYEPRIELKSIEVYVDGHRVRVVVVFNPINVNETVTFDEYIKDIA